MIEKSEKVNESKIDFHDICSTCKHYEPYQLYNHCCQIDIDTPLRYSGACENYEYDPHCAEFDPLTKDVDYSYLKEGPKGKIVLWL